MANTYSINHPDDLNALWTARGFNRNHHPDIPNYNVNVTFKTKKDRHELLKDLRASHKMMLKAVFDARYKELFDEDSQLTIQTDTRTIKVRKAGGYFYFIAY